MKIAALTIVAALVACGCAGDPDQRPAESTSSSTDLPEFSSGLGCPPAPEGFGLPAGSGCVSSVVGEADGFDEPVTVSVYARLDEDSLPTEWRIRLEDGLLDQPLEAGSEHSYPRIVGGADVDGDGADEWFVKALNLAGHGAAWGALNLYVLKDRFRVVTLDGEPMPLYVGGISRTGEGISCDGGRLVQLRAEARNRRNTNWDVSARYFRIDGTKAAELRRDADILELSDYNDPDLNRYYDLNCDGLHYVIAG